MSFNVCRKRNSCKSPALTQLTLPRDVLFCLFVVVVVVVVVVVLFCFLFRFLFFLLMTAKNVLKHTKHVHSDCFYSSTPLFCGVRRRFCFALGKAPAGRDNPRNRGRLAYTEVNYS